MGFTRRRSDRPDQARFRLGSNLEHLESRALLAASSSGHSFYTPSDLPPRTISHSFAPDPDQSPDRDERQAALVPGQRRQGRHRQGPRGQRVHHHGARARRGDRDRRHPQRRHPGRRHRHDPARRHEPEEYLCHRPGPVVLQGADRRHDPVQSPLECRGGGLDHPQRLHAGADGRPARRDARTTSNTGIFLEGGVGTLQFHNIEAPIDLATADLPINIIIGGSRRSSRGSASTASSTP